MNSEMQDLIEQLSYHDHEAGTDVVSELVELIAHAREEQFTPAELDVQLSGLLNSLLDNSVLDGDEHVALVSEVFRRVPELFVL